MSSLEQSVQQEINRLEDTAVDWTRSLVRIPSITGNEKPVQFHVADLFRGIGLSVDLWYPTRLELESHSAFSDDALPLGDRPVVAGRWQGSDASRSLILNGHVDVVPPGSEAAWKDDPWSGNVSEGKIFGRGSCDMKGGLVSGMIALQALRNLHLSPSGSVCIESVIGEETGGAGTLATILRGYTADAAMVLEPTRLAICPTGAGAASFRLIVNGKPAHAAMRRQGVSAVEKFYTLSAAIQDLESLRHRTFSHPLYLDDPLVAPISIGKIQAGDWPSTVPETLIAEGRYGILPGESMSQAKTQFEQAIVSCCRQDDWLREHPAVVQWFEGQFEPAETPLNSEWISVLSGAHTDVCKRGPSVHGVTYGSDLRFFTNHAKMPAVLYGPGDVSIAHSIDEHISIQEILSAAKVVAVSILRWCGVNE